MTTDPALIGKVINVKGDSVTATVLPGAAPGLMFSRGHAYYVGQVGAYVRIPLGLVDLFAVVIQVGSNEGDETSDDNGDIPVVAKGQPWMKLELLGEAHRTGVFARGIARYPAIGDPVVLVTADDLEKLYNTSDEVQSLRLGHIASAPHLPALLNVTRLITRHTAIVGSTGSGKSTTVAALLSGITHSEKFPSARVLVIDVHGEYATALGESAVTLRVDADEVHGNNRHTRNLFVPYWALTFEEFAELTFGTIDESSSAAVQQLVAERKKAYVRQHPELGLDADNTTADTPLPFSIRQLWFTLHEMHYATHTQQQNSQSDETRAYAKNSKGIEQRGNAELLQPPSYLPTTTGGTGRIYLGGSTLNIRRQVDAMGARLRDSRYDFVFRPGPWDVDSAGEVREDLDTFLALWLGSKEPIVIADLSGVPNQVLQRIVSALLRVIYEALIWSRKLNEGSRERPLLLVLEEAHRYLGDAGDSAGEIVERIVKEGRKFGVGALVVSQRPSEIRSTVLSQIGSFVILRLTNATDRGLVKTSLPDNLVGLFDAVPVLRTGEAIVTGEVTKLPMRVVVESEPSERPDSSDPTVIGRSKPGERDQTRPGGWDRTRGTEDYTDVAWVWRHLNPESRKFHKEKEEK